MGNEASRAPSSPPPSVGAKTESSAADLIPDPPPAHIATWVAPWAIALSAPPSEISENADAFASSHTGYAAYAHARADDEMKEIGVDAALQRVSQRNRVRFAEI